MPDDRDVRASTAIYSRAVLSMYDVLVLSLTNTFLWRCPSDRILDLYDRHVSHNHLDVGVGTGYFLDRCVFPSLQPQITLFDLSVASLEATTRRIARYHPTAHVVNLLGAEAWPQIAPVDSIGVNYVLHCLPASIAEKEVVIRRLASYLAEGGVLFGATLMGQGVERSRMARALMRFYNSKKIFTNVDDSPAAIEGIFSRVFQRYHLRVVGCAVFFTAWRG